jgi:hypothetical protein
LKEEGEMPAMMLDRMKENILSGNTQALMRRFGGFGRGGGGGGGFSERPGESPVRGAAGRGGPPEGRAAGPGGGAPGGGFGMDRSQMFTIFRALRRPGERGFGRFGFGGGGGGSLVATGDYLVSLTVGDVTLRRVLRVERANGYTGIAAGFGQ